MSACTHPHKLVMGCEETGGRRFPMVWCRDCGAIKLDTHGPGYRDTLAPGQFMLPEREKERT